MTEKKLFYGVIIGAVIIVIGVLVLVLAPNPSEPEPIASFEECVAAGNPVMKSYPPQCSTKDGQNFVQYIGNELEKGDLIKVSSPRPNTVIKSPLILEGEARGFWYFEADFPGRIEAEDGDVVRSFIVTAKSEWMTEDFVPFSEEIEFVAPAVKRGFIILDKDNPSGLPEHSDQLIIPIVFE
jgi:hypothetical protein